MKWLRSWVAEQEVRGSIPGLAATISDIGYPLLACRYMDETPIKRRKSLTQPTNDCGPLGLLLRFIISQWWNSVSSLNQKH